MKSGIQTWESSHPLLPLNHQAKVWQPESFSKLQHLTEVWSSALVVVTFTISLNDVVLAAHKAAQ